MCAYKTFERVALLIVLLAVVTLIGASALPVARAMPLSVSQSSTWYLPIVYINQSGWYTTVWAQNDSGSTADIHYGFVKTTGSVCSNYVASVPAHAWVQLPTSGCAGGMYGGYVYGLDSGSTQTNVVAYAMSYNSTQIGSTGTYSTAEYYGYAGSNTSLTVDGSDHFLMVPSIYKSSGWTTTLFIQNTGGTTATFYMHYGVGGCVDSATLSDSQVWVLTPCLSGTYDTFGWVTNSEDEATAVVVEESSSGGQIRQVSVASGASFTSATAWVLADNSNSETTELSCVNNTSTAGQLSVTITPTTTITTTIAAYGKARLSQSGSGATPNAGGYTVSATGVGANGVICVVEGWSTYANNNGWDGAWGYTLNNRAYYQPPSLGVAASGNGGAKAVELTNARWFLTWVANRPTGGDWDDVADREFVPMVQANCPDNQPCGSLPGSADASVYLQTQNEPNRSDQGDLCPSDYVSYWNSIVSSFSGRRFVTPGVAVSDANDPNNGVRCPHLTGSRTTPPAFTGPDWITELANSVGTSNFSALGYHVLSTDAATRRQQTIDVITLANNWGVPEVWLNELDTYTGYGAGDLRGDLDWLAVQPKVTRIAYYQDYNHGDTAPLTDSGGGLTSLGKAYWMYR